MDFKLKKEDIIKAIQDNFIDPLNCDLDLQIDAITNTKYDNYRDDSINLILQSYETLSNSLNLLNNGFLVDSSILCRTAFENILTALAISEKEEAYNEFKLLIINNEKRDLTKSGSIMNQAISILKKRKLPIFSEISNNKLEKLIEEFYEKQSLFIHSSLMVSIIVKMKNNNNHLYMTPIYKINVYFVKIFLLYVLNNITGKAFENLKEENIVMALFNVFAILDKDKLLELVEIYKEDFKFVVQDIKQSNDYINLQDELQQFLGLLQELINDKNEKLFNFISDFYSIKEEV
ncbi:MAG TPA: hypothetical protein GX708_17640 [Gallicola sp.]|nr:hypothetical protein [Bacilli bacterium]HHX69855.1 hypothetical protein [Gallicola sp.]